MIDLEQVGDGSTSDRNFQKLLKLVVDTGGQSIAVRWGNALMPFGGTQLANKSVSHGLGVAPVAIFQTFGSTTNIGLWIYSTTSDATTVSFHGVATANIADTTFYWLVIGNG